MKTSATNKKVREFITGIRDRTLIPRPEFQRRLVWTNQDKVNFVRTVIDGYPFPEIYVADGDVDLETGAGTQVLVDGQQRITTLYQYFTGSSALKLVGGVPPYNTLPPDRQREFLNYDVATRDLGSLPKDQIIEVFRRINMTAYSLNEMEINNAVYAGELKRFAEELASQSFFERHRIFTSYDLRRMGDIRYTLTIVITMMAGYFNRDELLQPYLDENNDEFPLREEMRERCMSMLAFIDDCRFPEESRVWKKIDFFTVMIELDRLAARARLPSALKPDLARKRLEVFYAKVNEVRSGDAAEADEGQYYYAVVQASNDRLNRVRRGKIIEAILAG